MCIISQLQLILEWQWCCAYLTNWHPVQRTVSKWSGICGTNPFETPGITCTTWEVLQLKKTCASYLSVLTKITKTYKVENTEIYHSEILKNNSDPKLCLCWVWNLLPSLGICQPLVPSATGNTLFCSPRRAWWSKSALQAPWHRGTVWS